ncbi:MAG: CoA transferase [Rhizobiaceae bacterium]
MQDIFTALDLTPDYQTIGNEKFNSRFAVTDLATASIGAVGGALAGLMEQQGFAAPSKIEVDSRLASLWFGQSINPIDWEMPPLWNAISGDYKCADGWIKLHTNLPHHRKAALEVLGCEEVRETVAAKVSQWKADELEAAVVKAGGVAAALRSHADWQSHPQGKAVSEEPLIAWGAPRSGSLRALPATRERPLAGLRVLDLTRVLAGPVATRTLAGFGANVLRVDPPDWEEANIIPDVTLGKRCCHLDLKTDDGRTAFERLLSTADIFIHGYRPDALERLGFDEHTRAALAPNLIEVCLDAYGWNGPWGMRRGFDSLVQMSCGIAHAGMNWADAEQPTPLPVQALDHATGYLMAAAALRAITKASKGEGLMNGKLSLARTAHLLMAHQQTAQGTISLPPKPIDYSKEIERTVWGKSQRLIPPMVIEGTPMIWDSPAAELGSAKAEWE